MKSLDGDGRTEQAAKTAPTREAVDESGLRTVIECAVPNPSQYVFIDIGSGKGKALLIAAGYGFQRVLGIKVDETLHRAAEQNIGRAMSNIEARCTDVCSINTDACEFQGYSTNSFVFLFDSLRGGHLKRFARRLEQHIRTNNGPTILAYLNPTEPECFDELPGLEELARTNRIVVYGTNGVEMRPGLKRRLEDHYSRWAYVVGRLELPSRVIPLYGTGPPLP